MAPSTYSSSNNKRTLAGTRQLKRISKQMDTLSCHSSHLLLLFKWFNRHERPMLSQNRNFNASWFVYIQAASTTTHPDQQGPIPRTIRPTHSLRSWVTLGQNSVPQTIRTRRIDDPEWFWLPQPRRVERPWVRSDPGSKRTRSFVESGPADWTNLTKK